MARNDLTGTLFADRYRLERKLGSGGMADVWLAEDQELGRRVAVKILHERYANDEQFVERFRREATHAAGLSHPNIVSIYDRGVADGSYYIVMEYIEGRTLKELIVTRGPCPVPVAISYTRQILAALRYAHKNGIIHRDIKPHNVLVDREGRVKVADFGIARAGASEMTEAGSIVGTAQYLSPEQARGAPVDESSDLYSTGIVLYELLTGTVPFTGETPVEIAMKHLSQTPEAPSARRAGHSRTTSTSSCSARSRRSRPSATAPQPSSTATSSSSRAATRSERRPRRPRRWCSRVPARSTRRRRRASRPRLAGVDRRNLRRRRALPRLRRPGRPAAQLVAVAARARRARSRSRSAAGSSTTTSRSRSTTTSRFAVQQYTGIVESKAVDLIIDDGFEPKVRRLPNGDQPVGIVFEQSPIEGTSLARGGIVTILVSTGKKTVDVPDVVGKQLTDAVAALTRAGLNAKSVGVPSDKPSGTVTAQDPRVRHLARRGCDGADQLLHRPEAGRGAARRRARLLDRAPAAPGGRLRGRPHRRRERRSRPASSSARCRAASSTATKGSTVNLSVSNGPQTTPLPDVTGQTAGRRAARRSRRPASR